MSFERLVAMARPRLALVPLCLFLAACESDSMDLDLWSGEEQALTEEVSLGSAVEGGEVEQGVYPEPGDLGGVMDGGLGGATAYEFDALGIPAGTWDGYAQATEGSFLQCLVAWGPREARLAFSVGWQGKLFVQFTAPGWSEQSIAGDTAATIRIDEAVETSVELVASGEIIWASLEAGPAFADMVAEGEELVVTSGGDVLVFPLEDSHIAIPALYECLDREAGDEAGDGAFAIFGLELDPATQARLQEELVALARERGFADLQLDVPERTRELYGSRILLSGTAWGGATQVLATVFGARPDSKKALAELVDDAARICRGEVTARLVRLDDAEPEAPRFGRSSVLCSGAEGEFAMETLAVFSGGQVTALHALVRNPQDRARVEQSFDTMKATFAAGT